MANINYSQEVPRYQQIIVGVVLACISILFISLALYLGYTATGNNKLGLAILGILFAFISISYFLGRWAFKLIKGIKTNGNNYLISNFTLSFWGILFSLTSIAGMVIIISSKSLELMGAVVGGVMISIGSYRTIQNRKNK